MALSSLQWLAVGTKTKTEPNCTCICKALSLGGGKPPVNPWNGRPIILQQQHRNWKTAFSQARQFMYHDGLWLSRSYTQLFRCDWPSLNCNTGQLLLRKESAGLSRYSDLLWVGRSRGFESLQGQIFLPFSKYVETGCGAQPASYSIQSVLGLSQPLNSI